MVSPDVGGLKMVHAYAKAMDADLAIVAKNRVSATKVEAINVIGEVEGRNAIIVDDMTETGGTLIAAAKILLERGAKSVVAGVSHAVLNPAARKKIEDSPISELITTDSTPDAHGPKVTRLSIAPILSEAIRRIHNRESVTSLFDITE